MTLIFVNILYLIINYFKKNKKISKNINFIYTKDNKKSLIYIFISLICLSLFLISNNSGDVDYGAAIIELAKATAQLRVVELTRSGRGSRTKKKK